MLKHYLKTQFFFSKFIRTVNKASDKGLFQVCALIRGATRRNIRRRRNPSTPGTPPSAHTAGGLRVIAYVIKDRVGYVGPVKFAGSDFFNNTVPHIHEFGGTYLHKRGYKQYPKRSYMEYTLKQLVAKGMIPRVFSIGMKRWQ